MKALYHTQLEARTCTTSGYRIHRIITETISIPTPGAPDSHGRAPFSMGKKYKFLGVKGETKDERT
jgi:hypothetical protein